MKSVPNQFARSVEELIINAEPERDVDPVGDMVLLQFVEARDVTPGGIVVPEKAKAGRMPLWRVMAVGPGAPTIAGERVRPQVQVGDLVITSHERGPVYELPDRKVRTALMSETNIIGIARDKVEKH